MYRPALAGEVFGIIGAEVGGVTLQVRIVVQCALVDGQELMTIGPRVERTLAARTVVDSVLRGEGDDAISVVTLRPEVHGGVLLQLLHTVAVVEESPTDQVESTAVLTTELLLTLHIGNLLEEFVFRIEVCKLQASKTSTVTNLVDPVDSLLRGTVDLVLTLGGTEQHVGVTHHTEVDTTVQTCHHLVVETCAQVGELGDGQTTVVVVCLTTRIPKSKEAGDTELSRWNTYGAKN